MKKIFKKAGYMSLLLASLSLTREGYGSDMQERKRISIAADNAATQPINYLWTIPAPVMGQCAFYLDAKSVVNYISTANFARETLKDHLTRFDSSAFNWILDAGVKYIANNFPNLKELNLSGCDRITDAGLEPIAKLTNLEALDLSGIGGCTDEVLIHIFGKTHKLKELNLSWSVTNEMINTLLEHIAKLTNLKVLHLVSSNCGSKVVELGYHIAKLPNLEKLSLRPQVISKEEMEKLQDTLPNLQYQTISLEPVYG